MKNSETLSAAIEQPQPEAEFTTEQKVHAMQMLRLRLQSRVHGRDSFGRFNCDWPYTSCSQEAEQVATKQKTKK